jgi:hypothetical protein
MDKMLGNYEINLDKNYVRLKISENDYEYMVSEELFGDNSHKICRLFEYAYNKGVQNIQHQLRGIIKIK